MVQITVNNKQFNLDVPDDTPLLWVIREELQLTGTKFGCGKGLCGACTVIVGQTATRSCVLPVIAATQSPVTTIEGLAGFQPTKNTSTEATTQPQTPMPRNLSESSLEETPTNLHPVQKAWLLEDVVQCGYCQPGQILTAVSLLTQTPDPSDGQIAQAMGLNLCRCGTYPRIYRAIKKAAQLMQQPKKDLP